MIEYKGDGFRIEENDGELIFKIYTEASSILYSFLVDAIAEYERFKTTQKEMNG